MSSRFATAMAGLCLLSTKSRKNGNIYLKIIFIADKDNIVYTNLYMQSEAEIERTADNSDNRISI